MGAESDTVAGDRGRRVTIRKIPAVYPPPHPPPGTSRSDFPAGGQEGVREKPQSPGQSRVLGFCPSRLGETRDLGS